MHSSSVAAAKVTVACVGNRAHAQHSHYHHVQATARAFALWLWQRSVNRIACGQVPGKHCQSCSVRISAAVLVDNFSHASCFWAMLTEPRAARWAYTTSAGVVAPPCANWQLAIGAAAHIYNRTRTVCSTAPCSFASPMLSPRNVLLRWASTLLPICLYMLSHSSKNDRQRCRSVCCRSSKEFWLWFITARVVKNPKQYFVTWRLASIALPGPSLLHRWGTASPGRSTVKLAPTGAEHTRRPAGCGKNAKPCQQIPCYSIHPLHTLVSPPGDRPSMQKHKECISHGSHRSLQDFHGLYETPEFMIWCYKVLPCAEVSSAVRLGIAVLRNPLCSERENIPNSCACALHLLTL